MSEQNAEETVFQAFVSYAQADGVGLKNPFLSELNACTSLLQRLKGLTLWYDEKGLEAGGEITSEIEKQIRRSRIHILLITHAWFHSEFIWRVEWPLISEMHDQHRSALIPIIVEGVDKRDLIEVFSETLWIPNPSPITDTSHYDSLRRGFEESVHSSREAIMKWYQLPESGS